MRNRFRENLARSSYQAGAAAVAAALHGEKHSGHDSLESCLVTLVATREKQYGAKARAMLGERFFSLAGSQLTLKVTLTLTITENTATQFDSTVFLEYQIVYQFYYYSSFDDICTKKVITFVPPIRQY